MRTRKINGMEKLFWDAEIRAKPADNTQALAYTDWLVDHGWTLMGAKRHVTMLVREGTEEIQRCRVEKLLGEDSNDASKARRAIRMAAGVARGCQFSIEVVAGGTGPERIGDLGYFVERYTGRIPEAGEDIDPNIEWDWLDGPLRIIVGAAWVVNTMQEMPAYLVI